MNGQTSITNINNKSQANKDICDAFECNLKPSLTVNINCGSFGTLTIRVCEQCSQKFRTEN